MSTITTGKVIIYKPNFSVNQVDTLLDLPVLGAENTLYVIKDTGAIYLWNGSEFITANNEEKICLNTAVPDFEPLDYKNPTTAEVEAWSVANLTNTQKKNGTQLTYFVDDYVPPQDYIGLYFADYAEDTVITSCIVNGDELIITPIVITDNSATLVYNGELKILFDAWLLLNPGIEATMDDSDVENEQAIYINSIIGDLEVFLTYDTINDVGFNTGNESLILDTIPGFGKSCDQPDYIWTLNDANEIILSNKETYTSKTVYVDADSGSDVTGLRGYSNFPFKTIYAAVSVLESGDKLVIGEGNYTWSNSLPIFADITIEAKGNVTKTYGLFNNTVDITDKKITFKANDITANSTLGSVLNADIDYDIKNLTIGSSWSIYPGTSGNIKIKNLTKTTSGNLFYLQGYEDNLNIDINNYNFTSATVNGYSVHLLNYEQGNTFDVLDKTNGRVTLNIDNYTSNAYLSGLLSFYDLTAKAISDYKWTINVKNLYQRSWSAATTNYYGLVYADQLNTNYTNNSFILNLSNVDIDYPVFFKRRGIVGSNFSFNIDDLKVNYSSLFMTSSAGVGNVVLNSNIIYNVKKGVVYTLFDFNAAHTSSITLTNSTIVINGDFTTNTDVIPRFVLDATSKIVFKGKFNLGDKKIDLSNITGAGADNIYFDDCTIITTGTNSIDAGSAKNIKVMNTYSNKVVSANITVLIDPIVVNAIIN